jgi:hypothetical protein
MRNFSLLNFLFSLKLTKNSYFSHCRFKDGKQYPWSSEDTSSLILYPESASQTIYARQASKIDEGRYTCVLRNATHKMEHHIDLSVKSSSPDVPLATFRPEDQFVNIGGSARFYCEAFVGKKEDQPKILISIQWYQIDANNNPQSVSDELQEEVKREEEQIVGSYLTISPVNVDDYGLYMCRVEMGNSQTHRLEMTASLINAHPMKANAKSILLNPYFLGLCAAIITIITFFLIACCTKTWWMRKLRLTPANKQDVLELKNRELANLTLRQPQSTRTVTLTAHNDTKIEIGNT